MKTSEFFYTPLFFKRVMKLGESAQAIAKKRLDVQNRIRV